MNELEQLKQEMRFLLNSHLELIKALQNNNDGLLHMNCLLIELIGLLRYEKGGGENEKL